MERFLLLQFPTVVLALLMVIFAVGSALIGLWAVTKSRELQSFESHNDVAGFIIAVVGVVYGVLLAFVVVLVWERFDEARQIADGEAEVVVALYRDAAGFPAHAPALRAAVARYAHSAVDDEWPTMSRSQQDSQKTDAAMVGLFGTYRSVPVEGPLEEILLTAAFDDLDELAEARRARLFASSGRLPPSLWLLVLAGGAITVAFTYFFAVPSFRAHCLMVAALAALVGLTLFLIVSLDYPFTGDVAVEPTSLRGVIEEFAHLDAAG